MAKKYYLTLAVGAAAAMLMTTGPLAAHDCDEPAVKGAFNDEGKDREKMVFADKNRDGRVTRSEAKVDKNLERVFGHYDTNGDDVLDQAEFARLEGGRQIAEDNPMVAAAPMEPIEYPGLDDERLRPKYVVHQNPP